MINGVVSEIDIVKADFQWMPVKLIAPAVVTDGQTGHIEITVTNTGDETWWPKVRWQVSVVGGAILDDYTLEGYPISPGGSYVAGNANILTFHLGNDYQIEIALYENWITSDPMYSQMNPLVTVTQAPVNVNITFPAIPTTRKL